MKGLIEIIEEKRKMKGFLARVWEKKREKVLVGQKKKEILEKKWEIIDWLGSKPLIFVLLKEVKKKPFLRIN